MTDFIERTASLHSLKMRRPVCGVATNDADYIVNSKINGKTVVCPFYKAWMSMIVRSYSEKLQTEQPTYKYCSVVKEWLTFSNFRAWMELQDWKGKQLDKDILIAGNKEYGPTACVFVSSQINNLLLDCGAVRGQYPQGTCFHKASGKYAAKCSVKGKRKHLGIFDTIKEAEKVYLLFKANLITETAYEEEATNYPQLQDALFRHAKIFTDRCELTSP